MYGTSGEETEYPVMDRHSLLTRAAEVGLETIDESDVTGAPSPFNVQINTNSVASGGWL